MSDKPSDTIITVTISPVVNGKRKLVISGAPKGEMPVVKAGVFADVHRLFDETWVELQKRKPQVVTVKEPKGAKKQDHETDEKDESRESKSGDQSVADNAETAKEIAPEEPSDE